MFSKKKNEYEVELECVYSIPIKGHYQIVGIDRTIYPCKDGEQTHLIEEGNSICEDCGFSLKELKYVR